MLGVLGGRGGRCACVLAGADGGLRRGAEREGSVRGCAASIDARVRRGARSVRRLHPPHVRVT